MTIENAIQKAIEGGYDSEKRLAIHFSPIASIAIRAKSLTHSDFLSRVLIDPLFWQSLGKAMRWKRRIDEETGEETIVDPCDHYAQEVWLDNWHDFIDHLAEGKDIESFFANL